MLTAEVEPPKKLDDSADKKGCAAVVEELRALLSFLCIPTFCIMVVQLGQDAGCRAWSSRHGTEIARLQLD